MADDEERARAERDRFKQRFNSILANLFVEGNGDDKSPINGDVQQVVAEAIKLTSTNQGLNPKYFRSSSSRSPAEHQPILAKIDALGRGEAGSVDQAEANSSVLLLFSDFFYMCMAFKPRPGQTATAEDPNFDRSLLLNLCQSASDEVQMESLEKLGTMVDVLLEEGADELVCSPAKLRAVMLMFAHPKLADVDMEPWTVLKKFLELFKHVHANTAARDTLVRWLLHVPLSVIENHVDQLQTFLTVSVLMAQAEQGLCEAQGPAAALQAVFLMAKNDNFAGHIRNALRLLDIFWRVNEHRGNLRHDWKYRRKVHLMQQRGETFQDDATSFLKSSEFHNDAINDCEALLKHDLREMLEARDGRPGLPQVEDHLRKDFGVIEFSFVLTPVSKVRMLNIESMLLQREEVRTSLAIHMLSGQHGRPSRNLRLKVRRSEVLSDSLQQLAGHGGHNLKKPLKVEFVGEDGVDEGGVRKEFFQILTEQLYDEDYGMFECIDESRNFWFNKNSFETSLQFELFGIVLGLAIYNQVILDVKFPFALYKKLMSTNDDAELGLSDLMDFQPSFAQGLIALLEFDPASSDASFEDVFGPLRFVVEYECYGSMVEAELIEGGKDIAVSLENREDYIKRYCDWIFNKGVGTQYKAFRKGFDQCIDDTLFRQLFRADELELVICGSPELDFETLEKVTQYQDGYTADSQVMKWFWEVVHSLSPDDKKLFLQFCTGCDRAPVGGLGRLVFVISRAGPDSDSLPMSHTCFNHLLVPEYATKDKLDRLLKLSIQHSKGFGMA